MSQAKVKIENARSAAMRLEQLGEPLHAEAVRSLCRSNSALQATCSTLQADLQRALGNGDKR